jgi:3,4-dihydroxy 2-butanone 4-phosphate synthase/GTP cyclohydrolase II
MAGMAGLMPSSVICEVMNEDGTMARLPDLEVFAKEHGLLIGTIADLIHYRSRNESLITAVGQRELHTPYGNFNCHLFRDKSGNAHMALVKGSWQAGDEVPVRVHEPFSAIDLLDASCGKHSWPLPQALATIDKRGQGVAVLLNCGEPADQLVAQLMPKGDPCDPPKRPVDLRTYGVGAQILRELGVTRMQLLGQPRRMPSMTGYGLEVSSFITTADAA